MIELAREQRQEEGLVEIDDDARLSEGNDNGCYVAAVNRVGSERLDGQSAGLEFWGSSFVADPFGVVVAEAPPDKEALLLAEIDPGRIEEVRRSWPFLRDRRVDAYGGLDRRFLTD